jgi:hypothetical protein
MSRYEKLEEQFKSGNWLGKPFLDANDEIRSLMGMDSNAILDLSIFKFLRSFEGFNAIDDFLSDFDLADVSHKASLLYLETAHSINKAFNSEKYDELGPVAAARLQSLRVRSTERGIYNACISAHNDLLRLPELGPKIASQADAIPKLTFDESGTDFLEVWQERAVRNIYNVKQTLLNLLPNLTGKEAVRTRWEIWELEQTLETAENNWQEQLDGGGISTNFAVSSLASPGGAIVTMPNVVESLNAIANFFLQVFIKPFPKFPGELFGVLVNATTASVLKYFHGIGSSAIRYAAAHLLRMAKDAMPTIFGWTSTFVGAWAFFMAYAPLAILAAVLIIAVISQSRRLEIGKHLYLFGRAGTSDVFGFAQLYDTPEQKVDRSMMRDGLFDLASDTLEETGQTFDNLMGFATNDKSKPVMAIDFSGLNGLSTVTERFGSKIPEMFEPYRNTVKNGFEDFWK